MILWRLIARHIYEERLVHMDRRRIMENIIQIFCFRHTANTSASRLRVPAVTVMQLS